MVFLLYTGSVFTRTNLLPAGGKALMSIISLWTLTLAAGYLTGYLEFTEPDFMYELALTSLVDFPVYVIWNALFLLTPFLYIRSASGTKKSGLFFVSLLFPLLFALQIYQFPVTKAAAEDYISLLLIITGFIFLINTAGSILSYLLTSYFLLWVNLIAFGTESKFLLNTILASRYQSWEGLFSGGEIFMLSLQGGLSVVSLIIIFLMRMRTDKSSAK